MPEALGNPRPAVGFRINGARPGPLDPGPPDGAVVTPTGYRGLMTAETAAGDWFCFPQSVALVAKHALAKEHRWIVASNRSQEAGYPSILRTTKSVYGGTHHPPHKGRCGVTDCRIDEYGWIIHDKLTNISQYEFTPDASRAKNRTKRSSNSS